jgi:hypothetical protein
VRSEVGRRQLRDMSIDAVIFGLPPLGEGRAPHRPVPCEETEFQRGPEPTKGLRFGRSSTNPRQRSNVPPYGHFRVLIGPGPVSTLVPFENERWSLLKVVNIDQTAAESGLYYFVQILI